MFGWLRHLDVHEEYSSEIGRLDNNTVRLLSNVRSIVRINSDRFLAPVPGNLSPTLLPVPHQILGQSQLFLLHD